MENLSIKNIVERYCNKKTLKKMTKKPRTAKSSLSYCSQLYPAGIYKSLSISPVLDEKPKIRRTSTIALITSHSTETGKHICVICYCAVGSETIGSDSMEEAEVTACNHCFHKECIKKWKNISSLCPVCRRQIE